MTSEIAPTGCTTITAARARDSVPQITPTTVIDIPSTHVRFENIPRKDFTPNLVPVAWDSLTPRCWNTAPNAKATADTTARHSAIGVVFTTNILKERF